MEITRKLIERTSKYVNSFNGIALLVVIFINVINILMRYLFSKPVQGAVEVSCLLTLTFVSLALFIRAFEDGHVKVDFFLEKFPERAKKTVEIVTGSASLIFFLSVALKMFPHVQNQYFIGEYTQDLQIPIFLLSIAILIGLILLTIAILHLLISTIKGGGR